MKKTINNLTITSNMKTLPIINGYDLSESEIAPFIENRDAWEINEIESNYYFRVHGCVYSFEDFQDASCPTFEKYIDELYSDRCAENKTIAYICYGMFVAGAIVIDFYGDEAYTIYNFEFND